MTSLVQFQPSPFAPFSFTATLDGQQYTVEVTWNLFGQRWYFNVLDQSNNPVVSEGLVGSPAPVQIASLAWSNGFVTATTTARHGFLIGTTSDLMIAGCAPAAFNGPASAFIVSAHTFFWPLVANPGPASLLGVVSFDIDLVEQYFQTSSVVFRESTQNFEINP